MMRSLPGSVVAARAAARQPRTGHHGAARVRSRARTTGPARAPAARSRSAGMSLDLPLGHDDGPAPGRSGGYWSWPEVWPSGAQVHQECPDPAPSPVFDQDERTRSRRSARWALRQTDLPLMNTFEAADRFPHTRGVPHGTATGRPKGTGSQEYCARSLPYVAGAAPVRSRPRSAAPRTGGAETTRTTAFGARTARSSAIRSSRAG